MKRGRLALLLGILGLLLLGLLPVAAPEAEGPGARLVVHFIDVGQGDAIWVQTPGGDDILVDGGPKGTKAHDYLLAHGCDDIEYMLLTHSHADHVGGLIRVLQALPVEEAWGNGEACDTEVCQEYEHLLTDLHVITHTCVAPEVHSIGGVTLTVLHPASPHGNDPNHNSLVCRLTYGTIDVLLTGDIERIAETEILGRGLPVEAEVLKVAHHGSDGSSSAGFLAAVRPDVAVISVGQPNAYGHPAAGALDRLLASGARLYRTDRQGTVTALSDGQRVTVWVEKAIRLPLVWR